MREIYSYRAPQRINNEPRRKNFLKKVFILVVLLGVAFAIYKFLAPTPTEKAISQLQFDTSVSEVEKQTIQNAIKSQAITYKGTINVSVKTDFNSTPDTQVLSAYVPVTNIYSTVQNVTKVELRQNSINIPSNLDEQTTAGIAALLKTDPAKFSKFVTEVEKIKADKVAIVPVNQLSSDIKLLKLDGDYYLDSFKKGAIFRQAIFSGESVANLANLKLNELETKKTTLKVNMTGVTALTRDMMKKLNSVKDATYFSKNIGDFLSDADITHVSNEVSFKPNCTYSTSVFCAPSKMIDTLKDSGVDLVELTGNHNNDSGSQYNTDTINLYHKLGISTFGGGLNKQAAAEPYITDKKQSKIAFLGYNYPDSPTGVAIATASGPGANSFDIDKIKSDIASAKTKADFIIVDVQFWECYSYPDGFVEFPECDKPIGKQEATFRKIADLGADMVIGSQAHQPQTYEIYKGKPIYYGLGNLYFDQTDWPGTERGIILTHYFEKGKLIQTKLSPTIYDKALQTHQMTGNDASSFLKRLNTARASL